MKVIEFYTNLGLEVKHAVPANKINMVRLFHDPCKVQPQDYIYIYIEGYDFRITYETQKEAQQEYDYIMKILSEL